MKTIEIFTDGGCSPNPGNGGYGVVINLEDGRVKTLYGGFENTTNNRMEMMAVIRALLQIPWDSNVKVFTDSQYVKNGITSWMGKWKRNGWTSSKGQPVKNQDLWVRLDDAINKHKRVTWEWVKGHSGHRENEMADNLASKGIKLLHQNPPIYAEQITITEAETIDYDAKMEMDEFISTLKELQTMLYWGMFSDDITYFGNRVEYIDSEDPNEYILVLNNDKQLAYEDVKHMEIEYFKIGFSTIVNPFDVIN